MIPKRCIRYASKRAVRVLVAASATMIVALAAQGFISALP